MAVSASADCTVRGWDLRTRRLLWCTRATGQTLDARGLVVAGTRGVSLHVASLLAHAGCAQASLRATGMPGQEDGEG
jgi:hypothetical protein